MHSAFGDARRYLFVGGKIWYAVRMKVAEVEQNGTDWSPDPLEVDDIALQTFTYTSRGVEFAAFPCGAPNGECGHWG